MANQPQTTTPTDIERALAWLIDNSDGVTGLTADGSEMPWDRVTKLYLPWLSADFADKEMLRAMGQMPACPHCGADLVEGECASASVFGRCPEAPDDDE